MKCAFFFGAGASASVDMPTTAEMKRFLRDDAKFRVLERHIIFKDIEDVYTRIEELSNHFIQLYMVERDDRWSTELNYDEELKLDSEIEKLRNPVIEWQDKFKKKIQNYLTKHLDPKTHTVKAYKDLLEKLHKADADLKIITTNYDLLLDKALDCDLNDGFVPDGSTIKVWKNRWENHPSKPMLVQLHGAINWLNDMPNNRKNRGIKKVPWIPSEPMMLPLTLKDKDYSRDPYRGMFAKFEQIIADVDLCVVVGYTFRDRKILDVMRERLRSNLHVLLLDPKAKSVVKTFENTAKHVLVAENGSVGCDAGGDSRVYWCDIKFNRDTVDDISRVIGHVSELVGTGSADA